MSIKKEEVTSKRIQVINYQTEEIHSDVDSLNESLVDRDAVDSLRLIESIREHLKMLKDQIVNGDIV